VLKSGKTGHFNMSYPTDYIQRAVQLKNLKTSNKVISKMLKKEFPQITDEPDDKTLLRWQHRWNNEKHQAGHHKELNKIAKFILGYGLGDIVPVASGAETRYLITDDAGSVEEMNNDQLAGRLEAVVYEKTVDKYGKDKVLMRFLTHLEAEKEIVELKFDLAMRNNPYVVIQVIKRLVKANKFKGKCPGC